MHSTSFPSPLNLFVEPQGRALQNTRQSWVAVREPREWPDQSREAAKMGTNAVLAASYSAVG